MSADDRTRPDYSKGNRASREGSRPLGVLSAALLGGALAASVLLIVSDFQTLYSVRVVTVLRQTVTGHSHHGYAIAVIGVAGVALAVAAAAGRSLIPIAALALLGLLALLIALVADLPDVHSTGIVGQLYDDARASAGTGFYLETGGAIALLFSGGALLLLSIGGLRVGRRGRRGEPQSQLATPAPAAAPVDAQDAGWL